MHLSCSFLPTAFSGAGAGSSRDANDPNAPRPKRSRPPPTANVQFRFQTEDGEYEDAGLFPPSPPRTRASKPKAYATKKPAHWNKSMKEWPTRAYVELRQGNPYTFPRDKKWKDPQFYTQQQKFIYDDVYAILKKKVCPQQFIDMEKMTSNPQYFGSAHAICTRLGLLPIMELHQNYSEDIVAQFYATVSFHGENADKMTWMTLDKKLTSSWQDFGDILGYPFGADGQSVGWQVHNGERASKPDVLEPLYIPGWGTVGETSFLQRDWDIMRRIYANTLAPKGGNFDQIHAWNIDLLFQTYLRANTEEPLDVMTYIRKEMWLAIVERRCAPYAPYVQRLINRVFFRATDRRLDTEMGEQFTVHTSVSLQIKHHEAPRSIEERIAADAAAAEIIRAARERGERPPSRLRAHAQALAAAKAPPRAPRPPPQDEPSWVGKMLDKMKRSFCFTKDLEGRLYDDHVARKLDRQRQKKALGSLGATVSPPGSEEKITPPHRWKSPIQWSDDEEEGGPSHAGWAGAQWDDDE